MHEVKGMVQVSGVTYRIVKVEQGRYEVIRILDEAKVGAFETVPRLRIHAEDAQIELVRRITMTALKQAKISWLRMSPPRQLTTSRPPPSQRRGSGARAGRSH
jgi:hypothetical protein